MSQILETIIEFITSEKVAYVISLIGSRNSFKNY